MKFDLLEGSCLETTPVLTCSCQTVLESQGKVLHKHYIISGTSFWKCIHFGRWRINSMREKRHFPTLCHIHFQINTVHWLSDKTSLKIMRAARSLLLLIYFVNLIRYFDWKMAPLNIASFYLYFYSVAPLNSLAYCAQDMNSVYKKAVCYFCWWSWSHYWSCHCCGWFCDASVLLPF